MLEKAPAESKEKNDPKKSWSPLTFTALLVGSLLFWPLAVVGLVTLVSRSEEKRNQAILVMLFGFLGFLWGWRILWPYFVGSVLPGTG